MLTNDDRAFGCRVRRMTTKSIGCLLLAIIGAP
jgi:hypothetical protein